ncbi:MAG: hypothetical protein ACRDPO_17430 [Streptosporangiaceae bacterium]
MTGFAVEVFQNEYLPEGGREVSAIVTVTSANDDLAPDDDLGGAELIMIDCSGSMAGRGKIAAARQAAAVAIDAIRDGVAFAVIAGNQGARVVFPAGGGLAVDDLTSRRVPAGPQAGDYPTGSWGAGESRDYHVRVAVTPAAVGQEMLAARVSLLVDSQVAGQGLVRAVWTDEEVLSTRISPQVAHFTGRAELAQAIQEGLEARRRGDRDTATARLGRAAMLAQQSGNEDTARLLARVVDVVDAASGTVRLKKRVDDADEMALDTRSTKTARTRK